MRPFAKEAAAEGGGRRGVLSHPLPPVVVAGCHAIYSHSRSGCETAAAAVDFDYRDLCFVAINFGVDMLFDVGPRNSDRQTESQPARHSSYRWQKSSSSSSSSVDQQPGSAKEISTGGLLSCQFAISGHVRSFSSDLSVS